MFKMSEKLPVMFRMSASCDMIKKNNALSKRCKCSIYLVLKKFLSCVLPLSKTFVVL